MGRSSRDILACSGLLWLPFLLLELLAGYRPAHLAASPALLRASLVITCVLVLLAGFHACVGVLAARWAARSKADLPDSAVAIGCAVATLGSATTLYLHSMIRSSFAANEWPMPLALVVAAVVGGLASAILVLSSLRLGGVTKRPRIALVWLFAAIGGWGVLLSRQLESPATGVVVALAVVALASALVRILSGAGEPATTRGRWATRVESFALITSLATVAFLGSSPRAGTPNVAQRAEASDNVILIVVDTLRADHTSLGGYTKDTTPNLRRLAEGRATYFSQAWSGAPHTLGSVYALFTSTFAAGKPLPEDEWTIASAFKDKGFRTAALTANGIIDEVVLRRGFDEFWNLGGLSTFHNSYVLHELLAGGEFWSDLTLTSALGLHKESSKVMSRLAKDWIREARDDPFFLYLHYIDPHWPYRERGFGDVPAIEGAPYSHVDLMKLEDGAPENAKYRDTPEMREMIARYDEEIRAVDEDIADVVEYVTQLGLDDSTWVIVVGDHGEEFFEHNGFGHGHDIFEEELNVPMLILWPDRPEFRAAAKRIDTPVSLIDILPTLTQYLALTPSKARVRGRSLRDLIDPVKGRPGEPVLAIGWGQGNKNMAAYREGDVKIRLRIKGAEEGGPAIGYDLSRDPDELSPIRVKQNRKLRPVVGRARRAVSEFKIQTASPSSGEDEETKKKEVEDEALERLRALGYIE